jgi:hypothetical protein
MKRRPIIVFRPSLTEVAEQLSRARELASRGIELLKQPPPDTFLGRKQYEPIPRPDEEEGAAPVGRQSSAAEF